ncbi:hypothetical protein SDC9_169152 [bioreactor metagenome]|uniref:Uncharacterized protein n=1 Tax=bioreactor metagenome TaxID=1076179 RepID=A0A645G733_9ZZZZ
MIGFVEFKLRDKCTLALHTKELSFVDQRVDCPADSHARGGKLPAEFGFGGDGVAARKLAAVDAGVDALDDLPKDRLFVGFQFAQLPWPDFLSIQDNYII